ncbi:hypothetical protein M426DRAFT_10007 [Hypoxylon sp. CI-4A]|nr:hypothetical protein M426DRAFT_10007 [Hypoxylon sp. CI-4A]
MTTALRLATLSYAIALADASNRLLLLRSGIQNAGNWGPASDTAAGAAAAAATATTTQLDPVGWTPKPTAPPAANPFDLDLRRRQQTTAAFGVSSEQTCGYPVDDDSDESAITCSAGGYCFLREAAGVAGCCTESDRRNCRIPTTCIESQASTYQSNSGTLLCNDTARPHCVTYSYNADSFFDNFYGISFLACGAVAGASLIGTTPPPGWMPTSDISTTASDLPSTTSDPSDPVTVTVFPSDTPSSSSTPAAMGGTSSSHRAGAIAGGVIGGLAGLALIVAAIFFFLRYRKRRMAEANGGESSPRYTGRDYAAASVYPGGLPEPQYHSDFYGELPPQMVQNESSQHFAGYPQPTNYDPAVPRETRPQQGRPSTYIPVSKPSEDDIVSPITPGDGLNPADDPATYTWISNPTPPPQSDYSQFSPPPPAHFQSYRPYPGT